VVAVIVLAALGSFSWWKGRAAAAEFSIWSAWSGFGEGSSRVMESSGAGSRTWGVQTLVRKEGNVLTLRRENYIDDTRVNREDTRYEKPSGRSECDSCGKVHKKSAVTRPGTEPLVCQGRTYSCEVLDLTLFDCQGRQTTSVTYWLNRDVPGWILKSVFHEDGRDSTQVVTGFTRK
jgi:hypothetical protein